MLKLSLSRGRNSSAAAISAYISSLIGIGLSSKPLFLLGGDKFKKLNAETPDG